MQYGTTINIYKKTFVKMHVKDCSSFLLRFVCAYTSKERSGHLLLFEFVNAVSEVFMLFHNSII